MADDLFAALLLRDPAQARAIVTRPGSVAASACDQEGTSPLIFLLQCQVNGAAAIAHLRLLLAAGMPRLRAERARHERRAGRAEAPPGSRPGSRQIRANGVTWRARRGPCPGSRGARNGSSPALPPASAPGLGRSSAAAAADRPRGQSPSRNTRSSPGCSS